MLTDSERNRNRETYPTSDGEPMAETDAHRDQMMQLIAGLQDHFAAREDVYVSGNLLLFYQEGAGRKHIAPDVLVVMGIAKRRRDNFKIWEEGKAPDVVIEVTSASTRTDDLGSKKGLYAVLGVREYFIFDPLREYLPAGLRGFQLAGEDYIPMVGTALKSQVLGLELRVVDSSLRLFDPATGELLPVHEELVARADAERARADEERKARLEAERQLQQLKDELRRRGEGSDPA